MPDALARKIYDIYEKDILSSQKEYLSSIFSEDATFYISFMNDANGASIFQWANILRKYLGKVQATVEDSYYSQRSDVKLDCHSISCSILITTVSDCAQMVSWRESLFYTFNAKKKKILDMKIIIDGSIIDLLRKNSEINRFIAMGQAEPIGGNFFNFFQKKKKSMESDSPKGLAGKHFLTTRERKLTNEDIRMIQKSLSSKTESSSSADSSDSIEEEPPIRKSVDLEDTTKNRNLANREEDSQRKTQKNLTKVLIKVHLPTFDLCQTVLIQNSTTVQDVKDLLAKRNKERAVTRGIANVESYVLYMLIEDGQEIPLKSNVLLWELNPIVADLVLVWRPIKDNEIKLESLSHLEEENEREYDELKELARKITNKQTGVEIRDRKYHLRTYKQCCIGSEIVDWLVKNNVAATREEAVQIGNKLFAQSFFRHVANDHILKDDYLFYRFDEEAFSEQNRVVVSLPHGMQVEAKEQDRPSSRSLISASLRLLSESYPKEDYSGYMIFLMQEGKKVQMLKYDDILTRHLHLKYSFLPVFDRFLVVNKKPQRSFLVSTPSFSLKRSSQTEEDRKSISLPLVFEESSFLVITATNEALIKVKVDDSDHRYIAIRNDSTIGEIKESILQSIEKYNNSNERLDQLRRMYKNHEIGLAVKGDIKYPPLDSTLLVALQETRLANKIVFFVPEIVEKEQSIDYLKKKIKDLNNENKSLKKKLEKYDSKNSYILKLDSSRVEIQNKIGEIGGSGARIMGVSVDGWRCAMKEVSTELQMMANGLQNEIFIMQHLPIHPNLIRYHFYQKNNLHIRLFTELYAGTLREELTNLRSAEPLKVSAIKRILSDIVNGLEVLHSNLIIHRDIKSANIFITKNESGRIERCSVADFDTSILLSSPDEKTKEVIGSLGFTAPEVLIANKTDGYSFPCDVFSLGMVIYELLTYNEPFHQEQVSFRISKFVLDGERPTIAPMDPIYAPLIKLYNSCTAFNPCERPTVSEILDMICDIPDEL